MGKNSEVLFKNTLQKLTEAVTSWGEPELFESKPQEHLSSDMLPSSVGAFARAQVKSFGIAPEFPVAVILGIASVCCQTHTVEIKDGWTAPLSLFIVPVLNPGEKKSVVLKACAKPIDDWVASWNDAHRTEIVKNHTKLKSLHKQRGVLENLVAKGDENAFIDLEHVELEIASFRKLNSRILRLSDATPESLVSIMSEQDGVMSIISAEGGFINNLLGQYTGQVNADAVCKSYDADSIEVSRVTRDGERIANPRLTLVQCVQPVIWSKLFHNQEARGVGLTDRCLMLAPTSSIGNAKFDTPPIPMKVEAEYHNVIKGLLDIRDERRVIELSPEARKLFGDFYDNFNAFHLASDFGELQGWGAKICGTTARISAILQLLEDRHCREVSRENMERAILMSFYFQEQARLIYGGHLLNAKESLAEYVLGRIDSLIKRGKTHTADDGNIYVSFRELSQACSKSKIRIKKDFIEPLQVLQNREIIDVDIDAEDENFKKLKNILINPKYMEKIK